MVSVAGVVYVVCVVAVVTVISVVAVVYVVGVVCVVVVVGQGSKFKFEFGNTCATRCKFLGALPKF